MRNIEHQSIAYIRCHRVSTIILFSCDCYYTASKWLTIRKSSTQSDFLLNQYRQALIYRIACRITNPHFQRSGKKNRNFTRPAHAYPYFFPCTTPTALQKCFSPIKFSLISGIKYSISTKKFVVTSFSLFFCIRTRNFTCMWTICKPIQISGIISSFAVGEGSVLCYKFPVRSDHIPYIFSKSFSKTSKTPLVLIIRLLKRLKITIRQSYSAKLHILIWSLTMQKKNEVMQLA